MGLIIILVVLLTRYVSVLIPSIFIRLKEKIIQKTLYILTLGGIALAFSIHSKMNKDIWVTVAYIIVCFSILVQGMTIGKLAKK